MKKLIILILIVFALGWLSNTAYGINFPSSPSIFTSKELISPSDRITEDDISIFDDYIIINIQNATWARYADSNSMDPLLDYGANGIEIVPESTDDIHVGDIVIFEPFWSSNLIVHRVTQIGEDEDGWYCITKGDNSNITDPGKLRYEQIEFILVGILY